MLWSLLGKGKDKMKLRRLAAGLIALLVVSACTMSENLPRVHEGMSQAELEEVMGAPDSFVRRGDFSGLEYKNRLISGWSWDRTDYSFIFKNDRLAEWGAGQVRQGTQSNNVQTLILLPM
jgi:hypothetical protein